MSQQDTDNQIGGYDDQVRCVSLTRGKRAIVDADWYEMLSLVKWQAEADGYASRSFTSGGKRGMDKMHRLIMNAPKNMCVDHINGNPLDNRASNLRLVSPDENARNIRLRSANKSGRHGVSWHKRDAVWQAHISHDGVKKYIGSDKSLEGAIKMRDAAQKDHGGYHENHGGRV